MPMRRVKYMSGHRAARAEAGATAWTWTGRLASITGCDRPGIGRESLAGDGSMAWRATRHRRPTMHAANTLQCDAIN